MIFLIDNKCNVNVYNDLTQVSQMVEWQDMLDETVTILDDEENTYAWDDSQENEPGTVYNYSFKIIGKNHSLLQRCKQGLEQTADPDEYVLPDF